MTEIDHALQVLAERGEWHGTARGNAELVRVGIRRGARRRGIRVRTFTDAIGRPWAVTPDGLPGEEPWRGVAVHAEESGAAELLRADTLRRAWRQLKDENGPTT